MRPLPRKIFAYLFSNLKTLYGTSDLLSIDFGYICTFLLELLGQCIDFLYTSSNTEPGVRFPSFAIVLAVYSEICVFLSLNEVIFSSVRIREPRLYRFWLILVVITSCLLVRFFDHGLYGIGGVETPQYESFEECQLHVISTCSSTLQLKYILALQES